MRNAFISWTRKIHTDSHTHKIVHETIRICYFSWTTASRSHARHASDLKRFRQGWTRAVSPSANHWIMLIASDEWYYSVIPATLMAIHLAPSLPVISQPHVFWERRGMDRGRRVSCIRASSLPVRVKVRVCTCSGLCRASAITLVAVHSNCRYRHVFSPARRGAYDAKLIISRISVMK